MAPFCQKKYQFFTKISFSALIYMQKSSEVHSLAMLAMGVTAPSSWDVFSNLQMTSLLQSACPPQTQAHRETPVSCQVSVKSSISSEDGWSKGLISILTFKYVET